MKILYLERPNFLATQQQIVCDKLRALNDTELHLVSSAAQAQRFSDTEVLICPTVDYLPSVITALPQLKWIHFLSAGIDKIWTMPFDKTRYLMSKSIGVHADTISEFVIGSILYILKGFQTFQRQQEQRLWQRTNLQECKGKTLAIIGFGTIGLRLAELARALGMRVIGTARTARNMHYPDKLDRVYGADQLHEVVALADFVVVLTPLTDLTRHHIGSSVFRAMRPSAWFINVARGDVIRQTDLIHALEKKHIAGAILDVFEPEPLEASSPLWSMENVLITPHVAGTTQHYISRALDVFIKNYVSLKTSGQLTTPVSLEKGY